MRIFLILFFFLLLNNTHADILTAPLQTTQTATESQVKDSEKKPIEKKEKTSPIFNYIKVNQGSVKSPYHQGGVSFDVDPD